MKKIILFAAFLSIYLFSNAQKKMYVWPPEVAKYVQTNILSGVNVNIVIKDLRVITPDSEIKATFPQISDAIKESITKTYGNDFINQKSDTTVTIEVLTYDVSFYTGMWHAQTKYLIKINDIKKEVEQANNSFNTVGKSAAKKVLNKCFTEANLQLFKVLNDILRKE